jgi:O-antigen ligase
MRARLLLTMGWLVPGIYLTFSTAYALSNVFLALVLSIFVLTFDRQYLDSKRWSIPALLLLALAGVVFVGMLYTPAPWSWSSINLKKYSKMAYVVPIMLVLHDRPVWQVRALHAFAIGMTFVLISTWLNVWWVLPWSSSKTPGWGVSHHVMYALVMAKDSARPTSVAWWLLAAIGVISITHLSQGRTGIVVLLPALLVYVASQWGARKTLMALPVLALVLAFVAMSSSVMRDRIELAQAEFSSRNEDVFSSIGHRLYNWRITPVLIAEEPVLGHGTGAYHTEICRFLDKPEWCDTFSWHPHNQYLLFAADHGVVGADLYVALIASLFVVAGRSRNQSARTLLFALASILAIDSLINSPMFSAKEAEFFLYMMALLVTMCRNQSQHGKDEVRS